jgi:arsenate reductase (glutaredoxin)
MPRMQVQLFGVAKSAATRKAQRFFSERRIALHMVDLKTRPPSPGELRRFVERFGVEGILDSASRAYADQGLAYVSASEQDWIARLSADPSPLLLPLVRCGNDLTVGEDPPGWARLAATAKGG